MALYEVLDDGTIVKKAGISVNKIKSKASVSKNTYYGEAISNSSNSRKVIFSGSFTKAEDDTVLHICCGAERFKTNATVGHLRVLIDDVSATNVLTSSTSYLCMSSAGIKSGISKGNHTYSLIITGDSGAVVTIPAYSSIYLTIQEI
jgi:hypothetical protein